MKDTFVVTGGAGFIGSAFVSKLNSEGIDNIIIVDQIGESSRWKNLLNLKFADYVQKDIFLESLDRSYSRGINAIIHMGAISSTTEDNFDLLAENNYRYSCRLAEFAAKRKIRFIYASSAATYGDGSLGYSDSHKATETLRPLNRYGYSKQLFDLWLLRHGLITQSAGLKFFNVYGPNEYHKDDMRSVVHKAYEQIKTSGTVKLFKSFVKEYADGGQMRDFVYVKDCNEIIWWLLNNPNINGIFNVGSGQARTWNDLVKAVFSALGRKPSIKYIEMPETLQKQYQNFTEADISKIRKAGFKRKFHSLEDGIKDYVSNYLEASNQYL